MAYILRASVHQISVAVGTAAADSTPISMMEYAGGMIYMPATTSISTLTWLSSLHEAGPYVPLQDGAGTAATSTVGANMCCPLPAVCYPAAHLKAIGNAAGVFDLNLKT